MVDVAIFGISQRCGSTLVQRALNLRDDTLVWGENGRLLEHFDNAYNYMRGFCYAGDADRERYFGESRDHSVFIANMNPPWIDVDPVLRRNFKNIFDEIYDKTRYGVETIGFKEVLHSRSAIELLRVLYPDVRLMFIARNPIDCWRSVHSWNLHNVKSWTESWCKNLIEIKELENDSLFLWYEDMIINRQDIDKLAEFANVDEEQILNLIDAGRVGDTPAAKKEAADSKDIAIIERILDEKLDGSIKTMVANYMAMAGYGSCRAE